MSPVPNTALFLGAWNTDPEPTPTPARRAASGSDPTGMNNSFCSCSLIFLTLYQIKLCFQHFHYLILFLNYIAFPNYQLHKGYFLDKSGTFCFTFHSFHFQLQSQVAVINEGKFNSIAEKKILFQIRSSPFIQRCVALILTQRSILRQ
jgi:hypothetical protein